MAYLNGVSSDSRDITNAILKSIDDYAVDLLINLH